MHPFKKTAANFSGGFRLALPFLATLTASGCALPPVVTVASFAADGVSYVMSGRTVSDHVLSYAVQEDCAVYRVVKGESICHLEQSATALSLTRTAAQQAETPANLEPAVGRGATSFSQRAITDTAVATNTVKTPEAVEKPAPNSWARWAYRGGSDEVASFLALGSYRFRTNAVRTARQYEAYSPYIVVTYLRGENYYRVVVGPYSDADIVDAKAGLIRAGASPWQVRLCGVEGVGTNCGKTGSG
ncbi:MAG: hypothetical protein COA65_01100 [Rhodospirillaceae bacterium]|nr:MAG: hypothetical protein COA65_01100 [Rhodospirillaceae bacterium]